MAGGALVASIGGVLFLTAHPGAYYEGQGTIWDIKPPTPAPAASPPAPPVGVTNL